MCSRSFPHVDLSLLITRTREPAGSIPSRGALSSTPARTATAAVHNHHLPSLSLGDCVSCSLVRSPPAELAKAAAAASGAWVFFCTSDFLGDGPFWGVAIALAPPRDARLDCLGASRRSTAWCNSASTSMSYTDRAFTAGVSSRDRDRLFVRCDPGCVG